MLFYNVVIQEESAEICATSSATNSSGRGGAASEWCWQQQWIAEVTAGVPLPTGPRQSTWTYFWIFKRQGIVPENCRMLRLPTRRCKTTLTFIILSKIKLIVYIVLLNVNPPIIGQEFVQLTSYISMRIDSVRKCV